MGKHRKEVQKMNMRTMIAVAAVAICFTAHAATTTIDVGTVYTNSASYIAGGSEIVVPDGAAFDLYTVQNSGWYSYRYSITIAGSGPDGLGALRDTGTHDPKEDDVQISTITLSGDALIKSARYMALLGRRYAETKLNFNNHTLTVDMEDGKSFALFFGGPWNTAGELKLVNGVLLVPAANGHYTDFEMVTVTVQGANSVLNVNGDGAGIFVKDLLMSDAATLVGNGFVGIVRGTFKPSETDSAFTGLLKIAGNITIDLSGLDAAWKFPAHEIYGKVTSPTVTLKLASWATEGTGGKKLINWAAPPASVAFQLESSLSAGWRLVKRIDGLYLYPADAAFYAVYDSSTSGWKFYNLDWADVTASCGLSVPTAEQTVCFSSAAEYVVLRQLTFESYEVMMRSCTLDADAALTEIPFVIGPDAIIDVAGHKLTAPASSAACTVGGTVTSSAAGGVLELNVPGGNTNAVVCLAITGGANLQLWKTGAGRLSMEKENQSFGANGVIACVVKDGVLAKKNANSAFFGAQDSTIRVENGAQVDIMGGMYWDYDYHIAGDGPDGKGAIVCGVNKSGFFLQSTTYAHLRHIVLDDDASIGGDYKWALSFYNNSNHNIIFNGHTLTVGKDNFIYWISLNPQDSGKLVVGKMEVYHASADFSNVDVEVKQYLGSNLGNYLRPVKSLKFDANAIWYVSGDATDSPTTVYDTYRPSRNTMPSVELGAEGHLTPTLDLSTQVGALDGTKLSFADGATVTVNLTDRTDLDVIRKSESPYVVTWTSQPANVNFVIDAQSKANGYRIYSEAGGLRLKRFTGMIISVK